MDSPTWGSGHFPFASPIPKLPKLTPHEMEIAEQERSIVRLNDRVDELLRHNVKKAQELAQLRSKVRQLERKNAGYNKEYEELLEFYHTFSGADDV